MQQLGFSLLVILFHWSLSTNAKAIRKGPSNETLLVGQINGPPGGATRNLIGMILSINVFSNETVLHSSITPITTSTFPFNYSVDLKSEDVKNFDIVSVIWQPAYIYEAAAKLPAHDVDTLNLDMQTIKFVIIRGELVHDKHAKGTDLPATQVKLELIENEGKGRVVDQVDFICTSKKYPCPFEYWLDTSRIKGNVDYRLEAVLADRVLPVRQSANQKHQNKTVETKSNSSAVFKINPKVDTEINDYKITVVDVQQ